MPGSVAVRTRINIQRRHTKGRHVLTYVGSSGGPMIGQLLCALTACLLRFPFFDDVFLHHFLVLFPLVPVFLSFFTYQVSFFLFLFLECIPGIHENIILLCSMDTLPLIPGTKVFPIVIFILIVIVASDTGWYTASPFPGTTMQYGYDTAAFSNLFIFSNRDAFCCSCPWCVIVYQV